MIKCFIPLLRSRCSPVNVVDLKFPLLKALVPARVGQMRQRRILGMLMRSAECRTSPDLPVADYPPSKGELNSASPLVDNIDLLDELHQLKLCRLKIKNWGINVID